MMTSTAAVADLGKRLLEASREGNAEEVRQLMATGAPITTDWLGTSPLHLAALYGHTVTAEVLLRAGVSRDGKTKVDKTPLHLAAQHGHCEIARMLVKNGASVNATDMLNMTPLHWAVEAHDQEICKLLIENGATTITRNKFGKTAMDLVKDREFHDLTEILLCTNYTSHEQSHGKQGYNTSNSYIESRKRARTRKFPMTAGSWTGGDTQTGKDDKPRPKFARPTLLAKDDRVETLTTRPDVAIGNNLSSLVDAAAMVRSKGRDANANNRVPDNSSQRNAPVFTDGSVLDTLATLATASTQIVASAAETSGLPGSKQVTNASVVAPSYITLPGIQGPVQILQANPSQPGFIHQGQIASAVPAGMIQLASPLAFNILPGGRFQVGQPVGTGAQLNIPVQMPLQAAGLAAGHLVAVSSTGNSVAVVGSSLSNQIAAKQIIVTDSMQNRSGTVMSSVHPSATTGITPGNAPVNFPIGLLNTVVGGNVGNLQQIPNSLPTSQANDPRQTQVKTAPVPQISLQPAIAPAQIAPAQIGPAIQYANIGQGLTPIPVLPVAGLGGLQLLPQAMIPAQIVNALRGISPQAPQIGSLSPQLVTPSNAFTLPMSTLNLSSILPTAVSLAQLPIAHQAISTLAQPSNTSLSQQIGGPLVPQNRAPASQQMDVPVVQLNGTAVQQPSQQIGDQAAQHTTGQAAQQIGSQTTQQINGQSAQQINSPSTQNQISQSIGIGPGASQVDILSANARSQPTVVASKTRLPFVPHGSVQDLEGISPSQLTATKTTESADRITSTSQQTGNPFEINSTQQKESSESTSNSAGLTNDQILPHLQHLIYRQLLQQQQQQPPISQPSDVPQIVQSDSQRTEKEAAEETESHLHLTPAHVVQQTESPDFQGQQDGTSEGQSVDLLRFLEQARTEDLSKQNLKNQLQEEAIDTKLYKQEINEPQKEMFMESDNKQLKTEMRDGLLKEEQQDELIAIPAAEEE